MIPIPGWIMPMPPAVERKKTYIPIHKKRRIKRKKRKK